MIGFLLALLFPAYALDVQNGPVRPSVLAADCIRNDATGSRFEVGSECSSTEAVFNEAGAATNFRVETDNQASALLVDGTNDQIQFFTGGANASASTMTANGYMGPVSSQTVAAGNVVAANACGGLKILYAASAITTDTTNTFTAPAASNRGCCMNVTADPASANITLDANGNFFSAGGADVVLTPKDSVRVCSTGTNWVQMSALLAN